MTTLKDLLLEASKIYVIGMKKFIADKQKLLNLQESTVDKLRSFLMDQHQNRLQRIINLKNSASNISETEGLIRRYQSSCFTDNHKRLQYEIDLVNIEILIKKNKPS